MSPSSAALRFGGISVRVALVLCLVREPALVAGLHDEVACGLLVHALDVLEIIGGRVAEGLEVGDADGRELLGGLAAYKLAEVIGNRLPSRIHLRAFSPR